MMRRVCGRSENISHHCRVQISVHGWKPCGPQGIVWLLVRLNGITLLGSLLRRERMKTLGIWKIFFFTDPTNPTKKAISLFGLPGRGATHAVPASEELMVPRKDTCVPAAKLQPAVHFHAQMCRVSIERNFLGSLCAWCPQSFGDRCENHIAIIFLVNMCWGPSMGKLWTMSNFKELQTILLRQVWWYLTSLDEYQLGGIIVHMFLGINNADTAYFFWLSHLPSGPNICWFFKTVCNDGMWA